MVKYELCSSLFPSPWTIENVKIDVSESVAVKLPTIVLRAVPSFIEAYVEVGVELLDIKLKLELTWADVIAEL